MSIPTEVRSLLLYIAKREAEGDPAPDCDGLFSLDVITNAQRLGMVSVSIGSWQDDVDYCELTNKGREAIGLPRVPTIMGRLAKMLRIPSISA